MRLLGDWPERSYRRRLLDDDLAGVAGHLRGRVVEVGAGRASRRGRFRPPREGVAAWWTVDVRQARGPHVVGDARRLPFGDASVDTVVCLEVLEYIDDPPSALAEMRRILRPSGTLVLSTPFMHRRDAEDDLWRWTPEGLRRSLRARGFTVTLERAQGAALAVAANVLAYVVRTAPPSGIRGAIMLVTAPLIELLFRLDGPVARGRVELESFSTGYLMIARRD